MNSSIELQTEVQESFWSLHFSFFSWDSVSVSLFFHNVNIWPLPLKLTLAIWDHYFEKGKRKTKKNNRKPQKPLAGSKIVVDFWFMARFPMLWKTFPLNEEGNSFSFLHEVCFSVLYLETYSHTFYIHALC